MLFTHQFRVIDLDQSGAIEAKELQALTEYMGGKITDEEADALVAAYDVDRSGTIDFTEFLMLMFKVCNPIFILHRFYMY
jgi:Ca2+-binding EF-hand superfamily protein